MANILPARPRLMTQRRTFAVVASQYNPEFVEGLVRNFKVELETIAPGTVVRVHEVPGAFEIPIAVQEVAERGGIDAIIALGVIIQGATHHADLVARTVTEALMECSLRYRLPVIHEVLYVNGEQEAKERCLNPEMNRGIDAARAAVRVVQALGEIRGR